jgi:LysM repeat protein
MQVTQAQAVDWTVKQIGKSLDADGKYGAQCVDLINFYFKFLGIAWRSCPGAKDIWSQDWPSDQIVKIARDQQPQPGDVGVWGATSTNEWGHTFIVVGVNGNNLDVVDQNFVNYSIENGSPAARHTIPINARLLGFCRPLFALNPVAGDQPGSHTIHQGDTFWSLEQANGWPNNTLQQLNPQLDPRNLQIGHQIVIPGGNVTPPPQPESETSQRTHEVVNGENLSVIAARYGLANWQMIYDQPQNRQTIGDNPDLIKPGQVLIIP